MCPKYYEKNDEDKPVPKDSLVGKYVYCSWGYNQTNIDFAKIVRITERTIFCKRVEKEVEGKTKTSKKVKPTDKTIGEEFSLRVKVGSGGIYFKGTYPMSTDGSTRSGIFMLTDGRTFDETPSGLGH